MEKDLIKIIEIHKEFCNKYDYNDFKDYQYQKPIIENMEERCSAIVFQNLVNHIDLCYLLNKKLDVIENK